MNPLSRSEKNRRAMNGLPLSDPPPLIRKNSQRSPIIDLDAMDEAVELELARKAQIEEKEQSRLEHQAKVAAQATPRPAKKE